MESSKSDGSGSEAASPADAESVAELLSFEGALEQLESTVSRLEAGELPLEEALALFEEGVSLSRRCAQTLDAAEQRIEILVADAEEDWATAPFEEDEDEASGD